jgi:hypothetical protein
VSTSKSYVSSIQMSMFAEADKRTYVRKVSERNALAWGVIEDDDDEVAFEYGSTATKVAQRLDIMGFTLKKPGKGSKQARPACFLLST